MKSRILNTPTFDCIEDCFHSYWTKKAKETKDFNKDTLSVLRAENLPCATPNKYKYPEIIVERENHEP